MKNLPVWPPRNIRKPIQLDRPHSKEILIRCWEFDFPFHRDVNVLRNFPICIGETMAIPPAMTIFIFRRLILWWEMERIEIKPWRCWAMEKRKEERVAANRFDRRHNRGEIRSRGMSCQNRRGEEKKRQPNLRTDSRAIREYKKEILMDTYWHTSHTFPSQ